MCIAVLHTGVVPAHWALVRHDAQVPAAVLHTGVAPVHCVLLLAEQTPHPPLGSQAGVAPWQSTSPAQARHTPAVVLQTGVAPVQAVALLPEHCPQAPEDSQAGAAPPHSPSPVQARQVCVAPLHTGVVPPQSAFAVQRTHVPVVPLQTGVPPVHAIAFVGEHWPHAPVDWQAGVAAPHSPWTAQARQVLVLPLQMGVVPPQSALAVQRTHTPVVVSHTGAPPVHCVAFPTEHCPQAPVGSQAGVVPPHSPSPPQARQLKKDGSQMGVVPAQSAFARQPTHVFVAVLHSGVPPPQVLLSTHATHRAFGMSQAGVPPPQWVVFEAEHSPHAPLARHTGVVDGHSLSPAQARQVFVAESHVGFVAPQFELERHPTHWCGDTIVRQYGVAPLQSASWAQPSTVMGVGGVPGPPPLPSDK